MECKGMLFSINMAVSAYKFDPYPYYINHT